MPTVSIILPTYNRAKFLPEAFAAIQAQQWTDWELIVVDDGSTDSTRELVPELSRGWQQPVRYIYQENQGAYGARNTGLDHATGKYIAFYDSDDLWLPHHLHDCVQGLEANPDVCWIYGACRIVNPATEQIVSPNTFYQNDRPRAFLQLKTRTSGDARILEGPDTLETMLRTGGLFCGLQNSVIRSSIFAERRFRTEHRNESEDVLIVIRLLSEGMRLAYFNNVHVIYQAHDDNSTGQGSLEKQLRVYEGMLKGAEDLRTEVCLKPAERRALDRGLSRSYFWVYGYALLWQGGRRQEAIVAFRRALQLWPWDLGYWKTYMLAVMRIWLTRSAQAK